MICHMSAAIAGPTAMAIAAVNPEPMEWLREQEYQSILAKVERRTGVVTFEDRVRASLSLTGKYQYTNVDAIVSALVALTAAERVLIRADSEGITCTNERGHTWFLLPVDFVDCAKSGVATFTQDFLHDIRRG